MDKTTTWLVRGAAIVVIIVGWVSYLEPYLQATEKLESEKSMKLEKCLEEVDSEVYDLYSFSRAIKFSNPRYAKVVMNKAKYALKEGVKRCYKIK